MQGAQARSAWAASRAKRNRLKDVLEEHKQDEAKDGDAARRVSVVERDANAELPHILERIERLTRP
jgi:hypothetical protein